MNTADNEVLKNDKALFESYLHKKDVDFYDKLPNEVQDLLALSQEQGLRL